MKDTSMMKGGNLMKEVHFYRGHEHFVINKESNAKKEEVNEILEEVVEEKQNDKEERKRGKKK